MKQALREGAQALILPRRVFLRRRPAGDLVPGPGAGLHYYYY